MSKNNQPRLIVFAGPNGSGKSTFVNNSKYALDNYINPDVYKKENKLDDVTAIVQAYQLKLDMISKGVNFSFETVLSSHYNFDIIKKAKKLNYEIQGTYILTRNPKLNILRVKNRYANGGHDVPEDKIISRFYKSIANIPEFISLCNICTIYDNTTRDTITIYNKRKKDITYYITENWQERDIRMVVDEGKLPFVSMDDL